MAFREGNASFASATICFSGELVSLYSHSLSPFAFTHRHWDIPSLILIGIFKASTFLGKDGSYLSASNLLYTLQSIIIYASVLTIILSYIQRCSQEIVLYIPLPENPRPEGVDFLHQGGFTLWQLPLRLGQKSRSYLATDISRDVSAK